MTEIRSPARIAAHKQDATWRLSAGAAPVAMWTKGGTFFCPRSPRSHTFLRSLAAQHAAWRTFKGLIRLHKNLAAKSELGELLRIWAEDGQVSRPLPGGAERSEKRRAGLSNRWCGRRDSNPHDVAVSGF